MDENTVAVGKDIDLETVILQNVDLVENIGAFKEVAEQFQQLMMMYSCAIREVRTKLEVLNDEFQVQRSHNPISYSKYRVKKPGSILKKLKRRGYPVTLWRRIFMMWPVSVSSAAMCRIFIWWQIC